MRRFSQSLQDLPAGRRLVAVDGVDGSGKTTFAAALAARLREHRPVVLIHADDFLNPRALRYAKGRESPEGFWLDSYDHAALTASVLVPLGPGGDGHFRRTWHDLASDRPTDAPWEQAPPRTVTIVDGLFLHRDELAEHWDASFFLDAPFEATLARLSARDGTEPDPAHPSMRRYVEGQRRYFAAARPWSRATWVIDTSDPAAPGYIEPEDSCAARDLAAHP